MLRALTVLLALSLAPLPALAGDKEDAFLARMVGKWSGTGTITGDETGKLACTSTIRNVSGGINFKVKCELPEFGNQNFSGFVSYNDDEGRYEAKSSNGQITIGTKSGNAVIFNGEMKGLAVGTSVMKMTSSKITVDTKVKRPGGSGGDIKSYLELRKS